MNNLRTNYEKILATLQKVEYKMNFLNQIRKPKLSDIELMSIDSEYQLFRVLLKYLSQCIERSVYNCRKRDLFYYREEICKRIASLLTVSNHYIVYSMPLEVCKLSRSARSNICKKNFEDYLDKGYCASQGNNYYGYKVRTCCL